MGNYRGNVQNQNFLVAAGDCSMELNNSTAVRALSLHYPRRVVAVLLSRGGMSSTRSWPNAISVLPVDLMPRGVTTRHEGSTHTLAGSQGFTVESTSAP